MCLQEDKLQMYLIKYNNSVGGKRERESERGGERERYKERDIERERERESEV